MYAHSAGSTFGAYRLLGSVGQGGMADVCRAEWAAPSGARRPVALKRMRAHLADDATALRLFQGEARLALRLDHPNIVRALDAGTIAGQPFLALEMIDGLELGALWRSTGAPLPLGFCLYVAHELCAALAYAHALSDEHGRFLGLVHRDVSPSNVMIGFDGAVKLLDFGVAHARREDPAEVTRAGVVRGKIGYLAPELLSCEPYDHRADLFSLGVMLYELITHTRLFPVGGAVSALALNRACQVSPPSLRNPAVPPIVDHIVMRALARDPNQRYTWATEMTGNLAAALAALPWSQEDTAQLLRDQTTRTDELDGYDGYDASAALGSSELELPTLVRDSSPEVAELSAHDRARMPTVHRPPTTLAGLAPSRARARRWLQPALAAALVLLAWLAAARVGTTRPEAIDRSDRTLAVNAQATGLQIEPAEPIVSQLPSSAVAARAVVQRFVDASRTVGRPVLVRRTHAERNPPRRLGLDRKSLFNPFTVRQNVP